MVAKKLSNTASALCLCKDCTSALFSCCPELNSLQDAVWLTGQTNRGKRTVVLLTASSLFQKRNT